MSPRDFLHSSPGPFRVQQIQNYTRREVDDEQVYRFVPFAFWSGRWMRQQRTFRTADTGLRPKQLLLSKGSQRKRITKIRCNDVDRVSCRCEVWAENSKKIVLANFTGSDWCVWCNRLEEEVFETPEFLNWANKNAVLLRLDYPRNTEQLPALKAQNSQLAQIYNPYITGYPTVLFIDHEGNVLGKVGYVKGGPQAWIAAANQQLGIR